ncbi:MAG: hypothetical protein HPY50_19265 [Firmicutes bacterium]|nr:hypothetical protein [Bacillota bacterium]
MPLIVVTSPKAGTGRTSLAVNLGFGLLMEGRPVQMYDLGLPPGDLADWIALASRGPQRLSVQNDLDRMDRGQWNVIDLDWRRRESVGGLIAGDGCLLATTRLKDLDIQELLELEAGVKSLRGGRGIDLVVPTMVNSHHWAENEPGMLSLFEHFEEERIADPLPF